MTVKTLAKVEKKQQTGARHRRGQPRRGRVIMINDDYTPMDFVVAVLQRFFGLDLERASAIMLQVHEQGRAVAGEYSTEVAETKAHQVNRHARKNQYPLLCQVERIDP